MRKPKSSPAPGTTGHGEPVQDTGSDESVASVAEPRKPRPRTKKAGSATTLTRLGEWCAAVSRVVAYPGIVIGMLGVCLLISTISTVYLVGEVRTSPTTEKLITESAARYEEILIESTRSKARLLIAEEAVQTSRGEAEALRISNGIMQTEVASLKGAVQALTVDSTKARERLRMAENEKTKMRQDLEDATKTRGYLQEELKKVHGRYTMLLEELETVNGRGSTTVNSVVVAADRDAFYRVWDKWWEATSPDEIGVAD